MIKRIFALLVICGLMTIGSRVMAEDGNNVLDQIGDCFSGKGNMYGGFEVNHIPLPFVPATLTTGFESLVGKIDDGIKRDVRGYVIVAIDWRDIFK